MRILSKLLTYLLVITVFANTITFVLGIFYFFDFETFGMWLMELVVMFRIEGLMNWMVRNENCKR